MVRRQGFLLHLQAAADQFTCSLEVLQALLGTSHGDEDRATGRVTGARRFDECNECACGERSGLRVLMLAQVILRRNAQVARKVWVLGSLARFNNRLRSQQHRLDFIPLRLTARREFSASS